jgi:Flp pilus assembly protein TadG
MGSIRRRMRARGAVAVMVAASMTALMGFAAVGVDAGYLVLAQRRLQAATDAAALAGAMDLWTQTWDVAKGDALAYAAATQLSSTNNGVPGSVTITGTTVTGLQLSTATEALPYQKAVSTYNGIQVTQTASVPLYFASAIGIGPQTISATSKAGAGGGTQPAQYNVMIVLDSTASMNDSDSNCVIGGKTQTRFACAKAGALQLITQLTNQGDNVGLMIFPPISQTYNFTCGSTQPGTAGSYSTVPTLASGSSSSTPTPTLATGYLVSSLNTGYLTSSGQASTGSSLVQALGGSSGCSGISAKGGLGTFYAEALTAAQSYLSAESSSQTPPGQNAIVLLSDGDATSSTTQLGSTFSSLAGSECQAAIDAATPIKAAGTTIYTIAYIGGEASASTCGDTGTTTTTTTTTGKNGKQTTTTTTTTTTDPLSPCTTMLDIATSASDFFSDTCTNANGTSGLSTIFQEVAYAMTKARLLPLAAT